jgi:hypothetical protein
MYINNFYPPAFFVKGMYAEIINIKKALTAGGSNTNLRSSF